jgi:hypothetical protein
LLTTNVHASPCIACTSPPETDSKLGEPLQNDRRTEGKKSERRQVKPPGRIQGNLTPDHGVLTEEIINDLNTVSELHLSLLGHWDDSPDKPAGFKLIQGGNSINTGFFEFRAVASHGNAFLRSYPRMSLRAIPDPFL